MTTLRRIAGKVAVAALLVWSWLDTRTYTGPESLAATHWRIGAFAVMIAGYVVWSHHGAKRDDPLGERTVKAGSAPRA